MTLILLVLSILPGFAWLFFYLREDPHPEPPRLIALTFFAGAASALVAYYIETFSNHRLASFGIEVLSPLSLVILALIEELSKFGATYLVVHKSPDFDEPIDAMVYMVVAALGFGTLENIGAILGNPSQTAIISSALETASFRFVGATLLHTLTSALVGYYWAKGIREFNNMKQLYFGLALATALHAVFNYLILTYGNLVYSIIFVIVVGFFTLGDFEKLKQISI